MKILPITTFQKYNNINNSYKTPKKSQELSPKPSFYGFEQRAFISKIGAMVNNKEISQWEIPYRNIMIKADAMTASAEKLMPSKNVTFPKVPKLNLRFFDNVKDVNYNIFGTYISTQEVLPFDSEVVIRTICIPHGIGAEEMEDDKGIVVNLNVIDTDTNIISNEQVITYAFNGKTFLESNGINYAYDKMGSPINAIKSFKTENGILVNVYYDRNGEYDSTYFFDKNRVPIKADKMIGELYYRKGEPLCHLDFDGNVFDPDGYFMFKL